MNQEKIQYTKCDEIGTILYIAVQKEFVGYILIADKIKDDSYRAIKELKKNYIKQTIMLTGDRKNVGESVGKKLGIDKVYTELLPDGKVKKVEELLKEKSENKKVAFVGDGINDSPVLARADIGISMGGIGSSSAIEASDVVIMTDEISKITEAIDISKKTNKIIKQNLTFSVGVKLAILVLSVFGISDMWEAVFADVGTTLITIFNTIRILK